MTVVCLCVVCDCCAVCRGCYVAGVWLLAGCCVSVLGFGVWLLHVCHVCGLCVDCVMLYVVVYGV